MISLWGLYVAESHSSVRFKHTHIPVSDLFCQSWYGWLTLRLDWGVTENILIKGQKAQTHTPKVHGQSLCLVCLSECKGETVNLSVDLRFLILCVRCNQMYITCLDWSWGASNSIICRSHYWLKFPHFFPLSLSPPPLSYSALLLLPSYLFSFSSLSNYFLS